MLHDLNYRLPVVRVQWGLIKAFALHRCSPSTVRRASKGSSIAVCLGVEHEGLAWRVLIRFLGTLKTQAQSPKA